MLLLADLLRFSLYEADEQGKTQLAEEVAQIRNFIELNQLRFDYPLYLNFRTEGDFEGQPVIPLVLLTLTENIFKHGYLKDPANSARLTISLLAGRLRLESWNLKIPQGPGRRLRSIGIRNVVRRLDYNYSGRYRLEIRDEPESYALTLTIDL